MKKSKWYFLIIGLLALISLVNAFVMVTFGSAMQEVTKGPGWAVLLCLGVGGIYYFLSRFRNLLVYCRLSRNYPIWVPTVIIISFRLFVSLIINLALKEDRIINWYVFFINEFSIVDILIMIAEYKNHSDNCCVCRRLRTVDNKIVDSEIETKYTTESYDTKVKEETDSDGNVTEYYERNYYTTPHERTIYIKVCHCRNCGANYITKDDSLEKFIKF